MGAGNTVGLLQSHTVAVPPALSTARTSTHPPEHRAPHPAIEGRALWSLGGVQVGPEAQPGSTHGGVVSQAVLGASARTPGGAEMRPIRQYTKGRRVRPLTVGAFLLLSVCTLTQCVCQSARKDDAAHKSTAGGPPPRLITAVGGSDAGNVERLKELPPRAAQSDPRAAQRDP